MRAFGVSLVLLLSFWLVGTIYVGGVVAEPFAEGWTRTYGGANDDTAHALVHTGDGGYALAGVYTLGKINPNFWLVKTDAAGNMQWNHTYGGTIIDIAYSLLQTTDGGYALAGETSSFGAGLVDAWLVKTDSLGNHVWNMTYGGTGEDIAFAMVQTTDGGYALAGYTSSYGAAGPDFWLVKTDANGNVQWNKTYGGIYTDYAKALVQTGDGGYALAGSTRSFGTGEIDFWLVRTDSAGNRLWNKTYGGAAEDYFSALVQTGDGGYALTGSTYSFGGELDFWLVRTDASGIAQWNKTYGGTDIDAAYALVETGDGGYAVAGCTSSFGAGFYDFWLVKTDANGNAQWNKTYGETGYDYAYALVGTGDDGYALAGETDSFGIGQDAWLVKTDADGMIPEFPSHAVLAALLVVTSSAVILTKKKLRGKPRKPY